MPPTFAADTGDAYRDVADVFLPVAIGVFVVLGGLILLLAWRGRTRTTPKGREKNTPLELVYAAVLVVTAAILITISFRADDRETTAQAGERVRIHVVAAKWRWRFEYPDQRVVIQGKTGEIPTLVVPADTSVEFDAVSLDVGHGFWIPEMRFQRQLFPDRPTRFDLTFPEPGNMTSARCSFYCGLHHQDMRFTVRVLEPDAFRAWAQEAAT